MPTRLRRSLVNKATIKRTARLNIMRGRLLKMDDIISTNTLFETKVDFSKLNKSDKNMYINKLADEFLDKADILMLSLKDK